MQHATRIRCITRMNIILSSRIWALKGAHFAFAGTKRLCMAAQLEWEGAEGGWVAPGLPNRAPGGTSQQQSASFRCAEPEHHQGLGYWFGNSSGGRKASERSEAVDSGTLPRGCAPLGWALMGGRGKRACP